MEPLIERKPDPAIPAFVGSPRVLVQLKQKLGIMPVDDTIASEIIGFDRFPLRADSLFREEHELINMLLPEVVGTPDYYNPSLSKTHAGRVMLQRDEAARGKFLLAAAERWCNTGFPVADATDDRVWQSRYAVRGIFLGLLESGPDLPRDGLFDLLLFMTAAGGEAWGSNLHWIEKLVPQFEQYNVESPLTAGERYVLHRVRRGCVRCCPFGSPSPSVERLNVLLGDGRFFVLMPGTYWADTLSAEVGAMPANLRQHWLQLLRHAGTATGSRPSEKWLKLAKTMLDQLGRGDFAEAVLRWFQLVGANKTSAALNNTTSPRYESAGIIQGANADCLRGLLWISPEAVSADLIRAIGTLTASCYKKIPGVGPRAAKVGNAGVYALSQINDPAAIGQLALLKVKAKFGSAQKEIDKAFNAAAERSGLPRDEIEEMSIPSYGLTDVGVCEEQLGDFTARLTVTGTTSTELSWVKSDGKVQKGVPASVKVAHKEELKEIQSAAKDIQSMLPAQRERIDGLFLQQKSWPVTVWQERYLNHPLIGTLARHIIWEFKTGAQTSAGLWLNGQLVALDSKPITLDASGTSVELWHPIGKSTEEVLAWRTFLEANQIQQPFKQAHREIYVLTDTERNTRNYSNRFAAHIIKQHQFNALCGLRGWKNQLRLMVDAEYAPPCLRLPKWNLRAEFWIEGIGQNYGDDTNESGVFLRLSTDQVRFYRIDDAQRAAHAGGGGYRGEDAEPLALDQIPPLVFSEVMRDVDLFVGIASVGNDPDWADGGPNGRHRDYWHHYSFGELNASAKTRKEVLERLVPKLKIAKLCSFDDKFLVVKGALRTYRIHLGSGNIQMEPNNQYLCIVPKQGETSDSPVLLPFEGDRTLSVIISKAFMLADDAKIKDQSIVSQIKR